MIHLSVWSHIRRLVVSAMVFGTAVLFMLWLPIRVIKNVLPGFLPYAVAVHAEAPVNELSLELLLLQVGLVSLKLMFDFSSDSLLGRWLFVRFSYDTIFC